MPLDRSHLKSSSSPGRSGHGTTTLVSPIKMDHNRGRSSVECQNHGYWCL